MVKKKIQDYSFGLSNKFSRASNNFFKNLAKMELSETSKINLILVIAA